MIREILNGRFMECHKVQEECRRAGLKRTEIKRLKHEEGIKTVEIMNDNGEKIWLWFNPQQIWERYHA